VRFHVERTLKAFPRPFAVSSDHIETTEYCLEGKRRHSTQHLFQYTLEGEGLFWDGRGTHRLPAGTGFLCRINDPDTGYRYPEDAEEPWIQMFFTFHGGNSLVESIVSRFGAVYAVQQDSGVIRRMLEYEGQSGAILEMTAGEGASLVSSLLYTLADVGMQSTQDSAHSWLVREAQKLMRSRVEEYLNVGEVARMLNVSTEHLCRVFRKETGTTPLKYLNETRMRRARDLLCDTSLSCGEIAERLGFDNASHFARTFRRVVGTTPRKYRQIGAPLVY
jgi:AraC-like DNA-binding protein